MPARLECDGVDPLALDDSNGIRVLSLDKTLPEIRDVTDDRVDGDGVDDDTEFHGDASVTLRILVRDAAALSVQQVVDRLRAFSAPHLRPLLYHWADGGAERRIRLRANQQSAPMESRVFRQVQASWRVPDGVEEDAAETVEVAAATVDVEPGREYPATYSRVYPDSSPVGSIEVVNAGNARAYPVLRLHGPCTDPRVENQTVDRALIFSGITLGAGEWLEVDVRARTVLLNGDARQSRYTRLDFAASEWWRIEPGVNRIRYYPAAFSEGAAADVVFRSAWL